MPAASSGSARPQYARAAGLSVRRLDHEVVVHDQAIDTWHLLNESCATVFEAVDGTRDERAIAAATGLDESEVQLAVNDLMDKGLVLAPGGISRRSLLTRGALAGGALVAAPMVFGLAAPAVADSSSTGGDGTGGTRGGGVTRVSIQPQVRPGSFIQVPKEPPVDEDPVMVVPVSSSSSQANRNEATFKVVPGLAGAQYVSFQSIDDPNFYLRHAGFVLRIGDYSAAIAANSKDLFEHDASFIQHTPGLSGSGASFEASNFSDYYLYYDNYNPTIGLQQNYGGDFGTYSTFDLTAPLA